MALIEYLCAKHHSKLIYITIMRVVLMLSPFKTVPYLKF